jgi:hypothetical protein
MNYDIKHIASKVTPEHLKKVFEADTATRKEKYPAVDKLIELHATRIDDGVRRALDRARVTYAIDEAMDASQHQISATLVRGLISKDLGHDELLSMVNEWGLNDMLSPWYDDKGNRLDVNGQIMGKQNNGSPGFKLSLPTFINVLLPLAASYTHIRWAKLSGDRDQQPLLKYDPLRLDYKDMALCRVITSRVGRMSADMGYREVVRQSILGALQYSACINFPLEAYYQEKQWIGGKEKVVKEGVRWFRPHWTKVFFDTAHPLHTLNSDTGCQYVGYWSLMRFGDVADNKDYWNREKIGVGKDPGWRSDALFDYYQNAYPCTMRFPRFRSGGENNREEEAFLYRTKDHADAAVDITVLFHKLVPKDHGLGDYEYPVWMRFVYAADRTVIFAEPMGYCPAHAYTLDFDENKDRNTSLTLELIPFQDHLSNILSQFILTVKKNLMNVTAVNTDIIGQDFMEKVQRQSENGLRGHLFFGYSEKQVRKQQSDVGAAFQPLAIQKQSTAEILNLLQTVISLMERVLGFTAQEVGGQATHQQSATESNIVAANTSIRIGHTAAGMDSAIHAMKKAVYNAFINYGSDEVVAQVADLHPEGKRRLEEAGFKIEEGANSTAGVVGPKSALLVEEFTSDRDGSNRINEQQAAQMMLTLIDRLMVPQFAEQIGIVPMLDMLQEFATLSGIPGDFVSKIKPQIQQKAEEGAAQDAEAMDQVRQLVLTELAGFSDQIAKSIMAPMQQQGQQIAAATQALAQVAQAQQQDAAAIQQTGQMVNALAQAFDQFATAQVQPQV